MTYRDQKTFQIKEVEEAGGKKVIRAINKGGIGDLKIVVPGETDLEIEDKLQVIIKEVENERD